MGQGAPRGGSKIPKGVSPMLIGLAYNAHPKFGSTQATGTVLSPLHGMDRRQQAAGRPSTVEP